VGSVCLFIYTSHRSPVRPTRSNRRQRTRHLSRRHHPICVGEAFKCCHYNNLLYSSKQISGSEIFISGDNSVDIATGYGLDGRSSISGRSKRFFCSPQSQERLCGPPNRLSNGNTGSSSEGKAAGGEIDHSLSYSAEVKNGGAVPPFPRVSL
jgi:hypothetical protein